MKRKRYERLELRLSRGDKRRVRDIQRKGVESVRTVRRAQILEMLDEGLGVMEVARRVKAGDATVRRTGWRYCEYGLEVALSEAPRSGQPRKLDARQENEIVAMVCAAPPAGYERWTIRLITEQAMTRGIVKRIAKDAIHSLLRGHELKPWREKNVVRRGAGRGVRRAHGKAPRSVRAPA